MTHHDDLDRDLTAWLSDDGPRPLSSGLFDGIVASSRARRQQPGWLAALRGESMGTLGFTGARGLRIALVVGLVALAALSGLLIAGMLPTQPQRDEPLAFIRDGDLYLAGRGGSEGRLVLHQDGVEFSTVAWSPDGHALAIDGDPGGVVVVDARTGRARVVGDHNPAWSPDSHELAVLTEASGQEVQLRILDAETFAFRTAYPFDAIGGLAWSPDGRWISATGGEREASVVRLDVATGHVVEISPVSGHLDSLKQVSWSPDSSRVAFIRYVEGDGIPGCTDSRQCRVDVFVANADGSKPIRVNQLPAQADTPRWSPDGMWLAFRETVVGSRTGYGIDVVRPDGTGERTVVSAPVATFVWSADGRGFLFARWDGVSPAVVWETSLTGQASSLGPVIDAERTFSAGTGLSFDWSAVRN